MLLPVPDLPRLALRAAAAAPTFAADILLLSAEAGEEAAAQLHAAGAALPAAQLARQAGRLRALAPVLAAP